MQNLETIPKLWENGMTSDVRAIGHLSLEIDYIYTNFTDQKIHGSLSLLR